MKEKIPLPKKKKQKKKSNERKMEKIENTKKN